MISSLGGEAQWIASQLRCLKTTSIHNFSPGADRLTSRWKKGNSVPNSSTISSLRSNAFIRTLLQRGMGRVSTAQPGDLVISCSPHLQQASVVSLILSCGIIPVQPYPFFSKSILTFTLFHRMALLPDVLESVYLFGFAYCSVTYLPLYLQYIG